MVKRCKVFISYSHEDEVLKDSKVKKDAGYPRAFLSRLCAAIAAHGVLPPPDPGIYGLVGADRITSLADLTAKMPTLTDAEFQAATGAT